MGRRHHKAKKVAQAWMCGTQTAIRKRRTMFKYQIILYWSDVDAVFVAEVPELPGCMAHGDTQVEALENVNEAMRFWLDTAKEFGDAIPEPKGERLLYA